MRAMVRGLAVVALLLGTRLAAQDVTVRGVVQDTARGPIERAEVLVNDTVRARTDSLGRFLLDRMPAGETELTFRRLGYLPVSVPLTLVAGTRRNLAVRLATLTNTLAPVIVSAKRPGIFGTVVDIHGLPIPLAEVFVVGAGYEVKTDADGRFGVPDLKQPAYMVRVRHEGYRAATFSVSVPVASGREVRVTLDALPRDLGASAWRVASGYGIGDAYEMRSLDQRMRIDKPTLVPRDVLEKFGRESIGDLLRENRLVPELSAQRGITSLTDVAKITGAPSTSSSGRMPDMSALLGSSPRKGAICYFIDGQLDQSGGEMLHATPADWVDAIEILRADETTTLRGQLPLGMQTPGRQGCGAYVVIWMKR